MKKIYTFFFIVFGIVSLFVGCTPQKPILSQPWIYGITIDDSWEVSADPKALTDAIRAMPVKPTVRIVMAQDVEPSAYKELFQEIHEVAYIMACPVDSYEMKAYKNEEEYLERFRQTYTHLAPYTDIWEIGNEINGVEWIGQSDERIVQKVEQANAYIRKNGGVTALTFYYPGPEEDVDLFTWIQRYMPQRLMNNIDYAFLSYYEDDHEGYMPAWEPVFMKLEALFPKAKIGFGECGNSDNQADDRTKIKKIDYYYGMEMPSDSYVGGCFWWYWLQDCIPHQDSRIYEQINQRMEDIHRSREPENGQNS